MAASMAWPTFAVSAHLSDQWMCSSGKLCSTGTNHWGCRNQPIEPTGFAWQLIGSVSRTT